MIGWLAVFFLMGAAGTWLARRYALQRDLVDEPGERRSHAVRTPRGGGIAIVAVLLVACIALALREPPHAPWLTALGVGIALVAAVGWVDDHRPLSPWLRLSVHCLAAAVFLAPVWMATGSLLLVVLGFGLIVTLTNVWNFMDGINGLAASQAVLVSATLALVLGGPAAALGWAFVAGCVGFLPFNFPSARIFMGDVGSGTLGYGVGALMVLAALPQPDAAGWLLLPTAPFLVDAGLTLGRRVIRGERWWTPHVQHVYQVWASSAGHTRVTIAYGAVTLAGGVASLALIGSGRGPFFMAAFVLAWYTSAAFVWLWLQRRGRGGVIALEEKERFE